MNDEIATLLQRVTALAAENAKLAALTERYDALIKALVENGKQHAAARDDEERLRCGRLAQRLLLKFLWADPAVTANRQITAPLADVSIAAHDAGKGAAPDLFDHQPAGNGSKPTGTSRETIQGVVASAIYGLKRSGMGTTAAIEWVAAAARQIGLRTEDGGFVTVTQLGSWWKDLHRKELKLPAEAVNVFRQTQRDIIDRDPRWRQRNQAELLTRTLLKSAALVAPRSAPNPIHRAGQ